MWYLLGGNDHRPIVLTNLTARPATMSLNTKKKKTKWVCIGIVGKHCCQNSRCKTGIIGDYNYDYISYNFVLAASLNLLIISLLISYWPSNFLALSLVIVCCNTRNAIGSFWQSCLQFPHLRIVDTHRSIGDIINKAHSTTNVCN